MASCTWSPADIVSYYASYAASYDIEIERDAHSYPSPFLLGSWIVDHLAAHHRQTNSSTPVLRVLDVGCGTGQSSRMFFTNADADPGTTTLKPRVISSSCADLASPPRVDEKGFAAPSPKDPITPAIVLEVHGIDATPAMLDRARAALPFASLTTGNIEALPLPFDRASFHALVCVGVFDFIRAPGLLLAEMRALSVGQGAILGITMPERADSVSSVADPAEKEESPLNAWTRGEMEAMIRNAGWWVERHERVLGYRDSQTGIPTYYHVWLLVNSGI
ncbi:S-adenosyl-L-methionine-dependent methyltransferase [Blastocladiella britannica]|nr:S-adenosyl-L-methionine-dependent methyltransferase [Blastocladiella britannica]